MARKKKSQMIDIVVKKKVTSRDLERLEVARLNCEIEPCSKPSDLFEKLEEKRRIRHENILQELAKSLHEVNLKTENGIKLASLELKAQIKDFEMKLKATLECIDSIEVASFCTSLFVVFQNKANTFKAEQQKLVDEFYEELNQFENNRAKENAKLLHLASEEIRKVGYLLPYDVQAFVEEEILKMNQLSLSNRRCYEDLKLTLTLVTEETFKSFMDKVFCIRAKWLQCRIHQGFYDAMKVTEENNDSKNIIKNYPRLELKGEELPIRIKMTCPYVSCKAEDWFKNVEKIVGILGNFGKGLSDLYKKTIAAIYNGFSTEVGEIKGAFILIDNIVIEERVIKPLLIGIQNLQGKEIEDLEVQWQITLEEIRNQMKYVREFVREIANLWDRHAERLCESKKLILKALEKADWNNQPILQELEIKLNVNLDALRQEHVLSKLEKCYEAVVTTLEEIKDKYESMYLDDISIIEDFYKMMDLEADVLAADIQEYIYETNTVKFMQGYSGQFRVLRDVDGRKNLFVDMKTCVQQIQNLRFWKQGVWSALETISGRTREILRPRAEKWIKNKVDVLVVKKSTQLELLDKRHQRIQVEIYERRMAEIKTHQEMFDKHKEKIGVNLRKAKEEFQNLIINQLNIIQYVKENLKEVEENAKVENLPGVLRGNQVMLKRKKAELENDIQAEFERFRAHCDTRISDAQQINVNFMKSIKLFHEDGNYSSEEAKAFINLLEGIDKEIVAELKGTVKDSSKTENEVIKTVSEYFNPVIALFDLLYEEMLFNHEVQQRLQNFTSHIQESMKILKVDTDFLTEHHLCVKNCVPDPGSCLSLPDEQLWNFLIELLYKNFTNLLYPLTLPVSSVSFEMTGMMTDDRVLGFTKMMTALSFLSSSAREEEEKKEENVEEEATNGCCCAGKYPIKFTNSKNFVFRKSAKPSLSCKSYADELFHCEIPRADDGTFMAAMCQNFSEEFDFLQQASCHFYKKLQGRRIIREDLLPDNYDSFIKGVLKKFHYYNIQIQEFWLQIILSFLRVLGEVKLLANDFITTKMEGYKISVLKSLKNYEVDFKDCIETQRCENTRELEDLDKRLLPLHGYPDNMHLLRELEEEVVRRIANQSVGWEGALKRFKRQLKCFRVHHVQEKLEIRKIELQYIKLRDALFIEDFGNNLLDELLKVCNNGGFCIKRFSNDNILPGKQAGNQTQIFDEDIPEEHKLHILPENFHPLQDSLGQLRQIIQKERSSGAHLPTCLTSPEESYSANWGESAELCVAEKLNVLLKVVDFQELVSGTTDNVQEVIRCMKQFAESQEKSREEELFKWLNKWKLNVRKILKLYRIKPEENSNIVKELRKENNKPNPEKTSASVTSPRLCPTSKLGTKDTTCNIPKLKIRCPRDRPSSDEYKKRLEVLKRLKANLQKSKLTDISSSDKVGLTNAALFFCSPKNYHGQIPVLHKRSLHLLRMSLPSTRSPSPIKKILPKDKSSSKVKTITFDSNRSPSPVKRAVAGYKKKESRSSTSPILGNKKSPEKPKQAETNKQTSPRVSSPSKRKSKPTVLSSPKLEYSPKSKGKELQATGNLNSVILKQASQPSLCINEKIIQPQEKISLDHLKNEVYSGDHRRLSFEKVHFCIEKSVENLNVAERKRSYLVTYSSDDYKNQEEISLAFLQDLSSTSVTTYSTDNDRKRASEKANESKAAIRTLSGNELILTPSMKLDIEKGETDDLEISDLLHETVENFEGSKVRIPQDDANEYDSEVSTDGELTVRELTAVSSKCKDVHSGNSQWKNQEANLLNDVDYRQSVYHPAVSRRQKTENADADFKTKSQSIEENFGFNNKMGKRVVRSRSATVKNKYPPQSFSRERVEGDNKDRSWASGFGKSDGKQMYNSVVHDVPFYGMKRSRTKKERISGALLHFTLKVIRLLAIFNLWPGDNCYMLTSQSLRFAR